MKSSNLHIKYISLPKDFLFRKQTDKLLDQIYRESLSVLNSSKRINKDRVYSCEIIIQGLYECYKCLTPKASLSIPLHQSAYSKLDITKITTHSYRVIYPIIEALENLGWVIINRGGVRKGKNVITTLKPSGDLLNTFKTIGIVYEKYTAPHSGDVIVLRELNEKNEKIDIPVPDTRASRHMRSNLKKINKFIGDHVICLSMNNENLMALAERMSRSDYEMEWNTEKTLKKARVFNFSHTHLRRIFSRGRMDKGGRFYGGWWQFIPSEIRPYITINGQPTIEIDFSELHPRMMYLDNNLPLPEGDMYDIGLIYKDDEEKKTKRKIIKTYLNSLLNDESGRTCLKKADEKALEMKTTELKARILEKHPVMKTFLKKGVGLNYQFRDSEIAEKIMLRLMEIGIVCLPVHDSFICSRLAVEVDEMIKLMKEVYIEELGDHAKLKFPTNNRIHTDFLIPFIKDTDEIDRQKMYQMHEVALCNKYVQSWWKCHGW
jgi:hypothetical protein